MPKSPRSQPMDKGDHSLPSTPLLSSLRNNDEISSPLQESPIEGWKSGRARKKTFKGAQFEEKVKIKQKKGDTTEREVKKTADLSEAGHTAGNTSLEASKLSSTRKRGRPRKTPVTASPAMKVGRPAKDITGLESLESQEKCQDSVHVSSLSAAHDSGAEDASKPVHREDDSADIGSEHNIPAEESSVASNTKHRENTIADVTVCSSSLTQEELSALKFSLLEQEDGHQTVATSSQIKSVDETPTDKSSVDVPVKRKRGRPRKVIKLTNDAKQEENTIPNVSSDSLPREEISDFDSSLLAQGEDGGQTGATSSQAVSKSLVEAHTHSTMDMSGVKVSTQCRPGQPIEVLKASDGAEPGKTVTPKRGRGRPRKHRPEAEMESGSPSVLKTPKEDSKTRADKGEVTSRSGRKITCKKYNSESDEDEDNISLSEKKKKKKMTHKKNNSDEEEELEENTESRKGRKRKSLVKRDYKEDDSTEEATPARNRRSKVAQRKDSESDYDGEETEVVKNKRGRKPLARNESSAKTSVTIKACLRCEEQMESLKQYKRHLMTVHCAMYTEECPSGEESNRAFQHILKVLKQLRCPKCSKVFRFSQYYKHHRNWCGREEEQERCNECGHYIKAMWMGQHRQWHKKLNTKALTLQDADSPQRASGGKRRAATASLKKIKAAVARGDEEPPSSPQQVKKSKLDGDWEGKDEGDNDDDYDDDDEEDLDVEKVPVSESRRRPEPKLDYFHEHQQYLNNRPKGQLFPDLLPLISEWTPLSESEVAAFLPTTPESVYVSCQMGIHKTAPVKLQWGQSFAGNKQATAFVGGTVCSMEWCPLEEGADEREEVLAVSADRALRETFLLFEEKEGRGAIQFWTTGSLDSRQADCEPSMRLAFTLAHDVPAPCSMAWCPRGAYLPSPTQKDTHLSRLGLLAVCGLHGNVLVYSISTLEAVKVKDKGRQNNKDSVVTPPSFKPSPSLTLVCDTFEECGRCLSVAWQKGDNCDFIAAGHAKGFVSIWHLSSTSPLVRVSPTQLSPVRCFFHQVAVTGVDWSSQDATYLATGSLHNDIRVWDLNDTTMPLFIFPELLVAEKGPTLNVVYGSPTLDAVFFCDDQRDRFTGSVYGIDVSSGFPPLKNRRITHPLAKHVACVWDFSLNDWFNVVSSCDNTGNVFLSSSFPILFPNFKGLNSNRKGLPVFSTACSLWKDGHNLDLPERTVGEDPTQFPEDLHIRFQDISMAGYKDFVKTELQLEHSIQTVGTPQPADVMATAFNPHKASSLWLAAGTRAGFVRLVHMPCLAALYPSSKAFFKS